MSDENIEKQNSEPIIEEQLSQEDKDWLQQEKRREEADDRDRDLQEGWNPGE